MFSQSLQAKLLHLSRTVPPALAGPLLSQHAADLRTAALHLLGQPDPTTAGLNEEAVRLQLHLPLRDGGFAVNDFPAELCAASFVTSNARTAALLDDDRQDLHPFASHDPLSSAAWIAAAWIRRPPCFLPRHQPTGSRHVFTTPQAALLQRRTPRAPFPPRQTCPATPRPETQCSRTGTLPQHLLPPRQHVARNTSRCTSTTPIRPGLQRQRLHPPRRQGIHHHPRALDVYLRPGRHG